MNKPGPSPDPDWRAELSRVDLQQFSARSLSWIYADGRRFYKIRKCSNSVQADLLDPLAIDRARTEYEGLVLLHGLDDAVVLPLGRVDGCVVYPLIEGYDLVDESAECRVRDRGPQFQGRAEEGIAILGRLHRHVDALPDSLKVADYRDDEYLPLADEDLARALEEGARRIVIGGFEVRNLRYDSREERVRFIDPHHLLLGAPEEDVARYILSLLMINWGRHRRVAVWDEFDTDALVSRYEAERDEPLNRDVLAYMFDLKVAMRRSHARKHIRGMGPIKALAANVYMLLFFNNVERWRKRTGAI